MVSPNVRALLYVAVTIETFTKRAFLLKRNTIYIYCSYHHIFSTSPSSVAATDAGDDLLGFGVDEALALAHLVVLLTPQAVNQLEADAALHIAGHLVKHLRKAALHHDDTALAIHLTLTGAHLGIQRIDHRQRRALTIGIAAYQGLPTNADTARAAGSDR